MGELNVQDISLMFEDPVAARAKCERDRAEILALTLPDLMEMIQTPVLLLHGRHDRFVPFAHGEWLARAIPGVEARLSDTDGHLSLTMHHLDEVHGWLLDRW